MVGGGGRGVTDRCTRPPKFLFVSRELRGVEAKFAELIRQHFLVKATERAHLILALFVHLQLVERWHISRRVCQRGMETNTGAISFKRNGLRVCCAHPSPCSKPLHILFLKKKVQKKGKGPRGGSGLELLHIVTIEAD